MKYILFKHGSHWRIDRHDGIHCSFVRVGSVDESRLIHHLNEHIFHEPLIVDTPNYFVERIISGLHPVLLRYLQHIIITDNFEVIFDCYN